MKCLTGVRGTLSCAHHPVNADIFGGEIHGHSYVVWAWFENPDGRADMRTFQAALTGLLKQWDHKTLPADLSTGEAIAAAVRRLCNCAGVLVLRPVEGIAAFVGDTPPHGAFLE